MEQERPGEARDAVDIGWYTLFSYISIPVSFVILELPVVLHIPIALPPLVMPFSPVCASSSRRLDSRLS